MIAGKRYAVIGSRIFQDWDLLDQKLHEFIGDDDWIVSGGAVGADSMAHRWARENGRAILVFFPNYQRYGKPAPLIRNKLIIDHADIVLAFYANKRWREGGTLHGVKYAEELGREVHEFQEREIQD